MPNNYHSYDARLAHREVGAAALTATTVLGTITERAEQRTPYRTVIHVDAIKITANNELYQLVVECSNDDFTTVEVAAMCDFGATEVRQSGAEDSAAGDYREILWSTEIGDAKYTKSRVRLIVAGTSPSITLGCYSTVLGNV